jgi:4-amino-4-deoxy-L-arabinose transferase-like glycosyltransferase
MRCEGRIRTATEPPLRVRSQGEPAKPWLGPVDHDRSGKRLFDTIDMRGDGVRRPHHGARGANGAGSWADRDRTRGVRDRPSAALGQATSNGSLTQPLPGAPRAPAAMGGGWLRHLRLGAARTLAAHADVAVQVLLLAAIGIVTATNLLHWPDTQFDEGTYVSYAWAVQHGALANYTYGYGHPPLGWLLIFVWTWASTLVGHESFSIDAARQLMLVISLISCSLLYTLARRLGIGRVFAAAGVIVFALSPIALFYHRQVLLDNPAIAWALAAFVLARTPRRRLWAFAASGACFAASVLSKETTLVLLPALFLAAFQNTDRRTRRYCVTLFVSFFVLLGLAYPLYAALKGELLPGRGHVSLLGEAVVQLISRQSTGSILNPHSQTRAIVTAWLQLDPWLLGGAIVLLPIAFVRRSTRSIALAFVIGLVMVVRPGYLPNMYVLALLPFGALVLAGSLDALWRFTAARGRGPLTVAASALTLCGLTGLAVFHVAPRWVRADRTAMTLRQDAARRAAERWIVEHVGRDKRLIVSDDFWVYLVEHGFDHQAVRGGFYSRTVVFYWPLDYDPAVKRRFPDGWRDFDYVVSVQGMRNTLNQTPTTAAALVHSRVVASFGRGAARIEIRAIDRPAPPG